MNVYKRCLSDTHRWIDRDEQECEIIHVKASQLGQVTSKRKHAKRSARLVTVTGQNGPGCKAVCERESEATVLLSLWGGIMSRSNADISKEDAASKFDAPGKLLDAYQNGRQ